mgnify:FL=1
MKYIKNFGIFESKSDDDIIEKTIEFINNNESYKVNSENLYNELSDKKITFDQFDSIYNFVLFETFII